MKDKKIRALLEGLEAQDIDTFLRDAKIGDYRELGSYYMEAVRKLLEKQKPMKVYVVTWRPIGVAGAYGIECVRLTKEAAQAYINEAQKTNVHYAFDIEEFEAT